EHEHAPCPDGQPSRPLREHRLDCAPAVLRACEEGAENDHHGRSDWKCRAHDVVDELVGIQGREAHDGAVAAASCERVKREVPIGGVDEDGDSGDDAGPDEEPRSQSTLTPFRSDGCDHDPCFSPVSWKKTSSSDLSNGRSSLTPMPALVRLRLISPLFFGLVLRLMTPSTRMMASALLMSFRLSFS